MVEGNTGTLTNGATRSASGQNGKALELDGANDFVSTPDSASLDLGSAGTVMAWVRLDTLGLNQYVVGKGATSILSQNYALGINSSNKTRCEISNGSDADSLNSTGTLEANRWYHLACVWDGSSLKLYVDGTAQSSTQDITPAGNSAALAVGKYGGNARYLDGRIDDVRIYNRALDQTELQAAMAAPAGAETTAPTVSVTAPSSGTALTGTVAVSATASDNVGVAAVQFRRDGVDLGSDASAPYSINWNTNTTPNGPHVITAVALDAAGNATTSSAVNVTVGEATPPTTPGTPSVTVSPGKAELAWSPSTDASGVAYYRIHRATTSGFTPSAQNEIAQTTLTTSYVDTGDGSTNGLPAATYYYKVIAVDQLGNLSSSSSQGSGTVTADSSLPRIALATPTPAGGSSVGGALTLAASATPPSAATTVSYGFDPVGFRSTRTVGGQTTRFLLGGLIETNASGTITSFDIDGPEGDLAHYSVAPTAAGNPAYSYYSGHGDLAAEANQAGTRTRLIRLDPWGNPLASPGGSDLQELHAGRWDKKHDQISGLIEMGARPYDPTLGRFLAVDPIVGGALNNYDYAAQNPVNVYDLDGLAADHGKTGGIYVLRDQFGNVRYVGRSTVDVEARSKRSEKFRSIQAGEQLRREVVFTSNNKNRIIGAEFRAWRLYGPDLNKYTPIGHRNPNKPLFMRASTGIKWPPFRGPGLAAVPGGRDLVQ